MAELVRVVLIPSDADADTASADQFILDLKVDPESNACVGPLPAFGRRGDFNQRDSLLPFTLMVDGRVDYGAFAEADRRQDNLDIRTRQIVVGGAAAYTVGGNATPFTIKSVTSLA